MLWISVLLSGNTSVCVLSIEAAHDASLKGFAVKAERDGPALSFLLNS